MKNVKSTLKKKSILINNNGNNDNNNNNNDSDNNNNNTNTNVLQKIQFKKERKIEINNKLSKN